MSILSCLVQDCDHMPSARGWCPKHYQRWYATGSVADPVEHGPCAQCGAASERKGSSGPNPKYCSKNCSSAASYARRKDAVNDRLRAKNAAKPKPVITCEQCGESREVRKPGTRFCSSTCATRFRRVNHDGSCAKSECERSAEARGLCIMHWRRWARSTGREQAPAWTEGRKANYQKRRAQKLNLPADNIRPADVYERDEWACGICSAPVDRNLAYPDPMSPSLDHILPLSLGGHHVMANVTLAHLSCNVQKGNRVEVDAMSA